MRILARPADPSVPPASPGPPLEPVLLALAHGEFPGTLKTVLVVAFPLRSVRISFFSFMSTLRLLLTPLPAICPGDQLQDPCQHCPELGFSLKHIGVSAVGSSYR